MTEERDRDAERMPEDPTMEDPARDVPEELPLDEGEAPTEAPPEVEELPAEREEDPPTGRVPPRRPSSSSTVRRQLVARLRRGDDFMKKYWPYVFSIMAAILLFFVATKAYELVFPGKKPEEPSQQTQPVRQRAEVGQIGPQERQPEQTTRQQERQPEQTMRQEEPQPRSRPSSRHVLVRNADGVEVWFELPEIRYNFIDGTGMQVERLDRVDPWGSRPPVSFRVMPETRQPQQDDAFDNLIQVAKQMKNQVEANTNATQENRQAIADVKTELKAELEDVRGEIRGVKEEMRGGLKAFEKKVEAGQAELLRAIRPAVPPTITPADPPTTPDDSLNIPAAPDDPPADSPVDPPES